MFFHKLYLMGDTNEKENIIYRRHGIFFLFQQLNAGTWTATQRLTWNTGNSWYAAIGVDPGYNIHVTWNDNTPGNYEIYYRKGVQQVLEKIYSYLSYSLFS